MSTTKNKNTPPALRTVQEGNLLGLNEPQQEAVVNTNLAGLFQSMGPFTAGIFLDNDEKHRSSVENACLGKITVPIVNETPKFRGVRLDDTEYVRMLHQLSEKGIAAAKVMFQLRNVFSDSIEAYDVNSGVTDKTIEEIVEWVEKNEGVESRLVAIFDFDRTISVMEGGFFMANSVLGIQKRISESFASDDKMQELTLSLTKEGFAEYLAGGESRMTMLQDMFDYLYVHNVKIILLTNNTACSNVRGFFQEIMMVYTKGRPVEIICGMEFGYNKGEAIKGTNTTTGNLKSLSEMCKKTGGKRTKKIRKQIRKRKQTKKH